jgi:hypothetical protein
MNTPTRPYSSWITQPLGSDPYPAFTPGLPTIRQSREKVRLGSIHPSRCCRREKSRRRNDAKMPLAAGLTVISTSRPSRVRRWISRSVEKPDS